MAAPTAPYTVAEVRMAERVGQFLLPHVAQMLALHREGDDKTKTFCDQYAAKRAALDALPSTAGPMARVQLEGEMQDLAQRFVSQHSKG